MILSTLQGIGVAAGIIGACFVAGQSRHSRRIGFGIWIVGNTCWVAAGLILQNPFLVVMFGFYWLTAVLGSANNNKPEGSL
jgi:hypothetical protein